jgi:hypothetical protein
LKRFCAGLVNAPNGVGNCPKKPCSTCIVRRPPQAEVGSVRCLINVTGSRTSARRCFTQSWAGAPYEQYRSSSVLSQCRNAHFDRLPTAAKPLQAFPTTFRFARRISVRLKTALICSKIWSRGHLQKAWIMLKGSRADQSGRRFRKKLANFDAKARTHLSRPRIHRPRALPYI